MNCHWDQPDTRRGFIKLTEIGAIIGTVIGVIFCVVHMKPIWWQTTKDFVKRLFKK